MRAGQVLDLPDAHDRLVMQVLHARVDVVGAMTQTVVDKVEAQLAALFRWKKLFFVDINIIYSNNQISMKVKF